MLQSHDDDDGVDYVEVHRNLGSPRYAVKYWRIRLTGVEAVITIIAMLGVWWTVENLGLYNRTLFGIISFDWAWLFVLVLLVAAFSFIHQVLPDMKILEVIGGAFQPTQYKDLPDKKWRKRPVHKK